MLSGLLSYGVKHVEVVPIKRLQWLKIVYSLFTPEYYSSKCVPEKSFKFYLEAVRDTVTKTTEKYGKPVILVGHSAGGWLARAYLGEGKGIFATLLLSTVISLIG